MRHVHAKRMRSRDAHVNATRFSQVRNPRSSARERTRARSPHAPTPARDFYIKFTYIVRTYAFRALAFTRAVCVHAKRERMLCGRPTCRREKLARKNRKIKIKKNQNQKKSKSKKIKIKKNQNQKHNRPGLAARPSCLAPCSPSLRYGIASSQKSRSNSPLFSFSDYQ